MRWLTHKSDSYPVQDTQYTIREGEEGRQWDLPMQQFEQKSEPVLFKIGILHSLDTSFIVSPLGWPNLECQVAKERSLLERVLTWDTLGLILFTLVETESGEEALGTGSEPAVEMILIVKEGLSCCLADWSKSRNL